MTQKTKMRIGLGILIAMTLLLVSIYSYTRIVENNKNKELEEEQESQDDLANPEETIPQTIETQTSENNADYSTLKIEERNFSIDYPKAWTNDYTEATKRLNLKSNLENPEDEVLENFQITFADNADGLDLATAYTAKVAELKSSQFFGEIVEEKELQLAATTAKSIEYTFNVATEAVNPVIYYLKIQHIIYIKDNQIINITFSSDAKSFDSYRETVQKVLNSIK
jgi:hypothetical protein